MYRQNARAPLSTPTVIEYGSHWFRPKYLLAGILGIVVLVAGLTVLSMTHVTKIVCLREAPDAVGTCHVRRYGSGSIDERFTADEIHRVNVRSVGGSDGVRDGELRLATRRGDFELAGGVSPVDPETALDFQAKVVAFKEKRVVAVDEWLWRPWSTILQTLLAVGLVAIGVRFLCELLGQFRKIRIVVDHAREVIVIGRSKVPFHEVQEVVVHQGLAHFLSSGKNAHIPGHRLAVVRKTGDVVHATKEFRADSAGTHEQARKHLLTAIGFPS